jgi:Fn3 associated
MLSLKAFRWVSMLSGSVLCLSWLALPAPPLRAQEAKKPPLGVAWNVQGVWQAGGKGAPILTGDPLLPGSLLQPSNGTANHSIIVLLPDGQRILYECFTAEDCARGFRVPALFRPPEPFAVDMLARIRTALVRGNHAFSVGIQPVPRWPRDEVVAELDPDNRVHVAGLAAKLPNGRYTYDLQPLDPTHPRQSHLVLEKTAPSIPLPLPSAGLYVVTIADDQNTPRIDLFVAAAGPAQAASLQKSFHDANSLLKQWNSDYYGWPVHDFQWAYLQSFMLGAKSPAAGLPVQIPPVELTASGQSSAAEMHPQGVTADPTFLPKAGFLAGDTAVTFQCEAPGATIHYTVDFSQPVASSPVYRAPIMVKGSGLTIKAFASAAGKKDSAVVTGTFRIQKRPQTEGASSHQ